jgi:hypothetical protein
MRSQRKAWQKAGFDEILTSKFVGRTFRIFVVNSHAISEYFLTTFLSWTLGWLPDQTIICANNQYEKLRDVVNPLCLEKKYGGVCANKYSDFYPPDMRMPHYNLKDKKDPLTLEEVMVELKSQQFESLPV